MEALLKYRNTPGLSHTNRNTDKSFFTDKDKKNVRSPHAMVQPKLELTTPGDSHEQEADRMADFVMRKAFSGSSGIPTEHPSRTSALPPVISRQTDGVSSGIAIDSTTENSINASRGGGQPLPGTLRTKMESGFGADFSGVRLHTGSQAADLSNTLQAKAFTCGNDIFFNSEQYDPQSALGQHLIAHELTHVVQQSGKVGRCCIKDRRIKEALYLLFNFRNALIVGHPRYMDGLSEIASNFSINIATAALLTHGKEGDERNAVRHVLWQALITRDLGEKEATEIAYAHEDGCGPEFYEVVKEHQSLEDADRAVDLLNNAIGRGIGRFSPEANNKEMAKKVMAEYRTSGLWIVVEEGEDKYIIQKQQLPECLYRLALAEIDKKSESGLNREGFINNESINIVCFSASESNSLNYINKLIKSQNSCAINPTILDRFFEYVAAMQNRMNETKIENGEKEEQVIPSPIELSRYNRVQRAEYLFGEKSEDALQKKRVYDDKETAESYMKRISVKVWTQNGEATANLRIHRKLSHVVEQIFKEVYDYYSDNPQQQTDDNFRFNIRDKDFGGFVWRYPRYDIKENEVMKKKLCDSNKDLENKKVQLENEKAQLEGKAEKRKKDGEIKVKERQIEKNKNAIAGLEKKIGEISERDAVLRSEIKTLEDDIEKKKGEIENKNIEIEKLRKKINYIDNGETIENEKQYLRSVSSEEYKKTEMEKLSETKNRLECQKKELEDRLRKVESLEGQYPTDEAKKQIIERLQNEITNNRFDERKLKRMEERVGSEKEKLRDSDQIKKYRDQKEIIATNEDTISLLSIGIEGKDEINTKIDSLNEKMEKIDEEFLSIKESDDASINELIKSRITEIEKFEQEIRIDGRDKTDKKLKEAIRNVKNINSKITNNNNAINKKRGELSENMSLLFSEHSTGVAIDLNPKHNPYVVGLNPHEAGHKETKDGGVYDEYTIKSNSEIVKIFKKYGWSWGGGWRGKKDYMHFEWFSKTFPKN
ncbi:MAG: eCIS core domain-containing protein [Tannerella sp.]|uniref:eCIS core domain-containing protein n=1 Tax=Tannerella sp. TaxID=2382127 RepID=UPI003FA2B274